MTDSGVALAVQVLRVYLATLTSCDRTAGLSALCTLIYQDRLNAVPLDQSDPRAAIDDGVPTLRRHHRRPPHPWNRSC